MRILLVNPSTKNMLVANNPTFVDDSRGENMPLGLGYLASSLLKHNHTVHIHDCQIQKDLELIASLRFGNYDIVGLTTTTFTLRGTKDIINAVRTYDSKIKIIVGGTHPTIYPEETLKLGADAVIQGEGEEIMPGIFHLLWKYPKSIHVNHVRIDDLDNLPFPMRIHVDKYNSIFSSGIATTIITSRGCPYKCSFCYRPVFGRTVRQRSPDNIIDEIKVCVAKGIKNFLFYDDTFTLDKKRVYLLCEKIHKLPYKIKFDIRSRVNTVNYDLLKSLKNVGMTQIHFGIESGVQRILDRMNKGITLEQIRQAFDWCHKLRIKTLGYIMIGNPGESIEDITTTEKLVHKLNPDYLHATIFTPFPATDSYKQWVELFKEDVWLEYAKHPTKDFVPPVWGNWNRKLFNEILIGIYKRFYLRPSYIMKRVMDIGSISRLKKYIKAGRRLLNEKL